ncbi:hypothetical protein JNK13_05345 [bacterium]|nr:hypothetical protein [bacterium]
MHNLEALAAVFICIFGVAHLIVPFFDAQVLIDEPKAVTALDQALKPQVEPQVFEVELEEDFKAGKLSLEEYQAEKKHFSPNTPDTD